MLEPEPSNPPATRTPPDGSSVAVCRSRAVAIGATGLHAASSPAAVALRPAVAAEELADCPSHEATTSAPTSSATWRRITNGLITLPQRRQRSVSGAMPLPRRPTTTPAPLVRTWREAMRVDFR
jgi:hypothetical protein